MLQLRSKNSRGKTYCYYVLQELSLFPRLSASYYWTSDTKAEVDFVFSEGLEVYPMEVKAGNNVHAKSLKVYDEKYNPKCLFRTSLLPYKKNGKLVNVPLYMLKSYLLISYA